MIERIERSISTTITTQIGPIRLTAGLRSSRPGRQLKVSIDLSAIPRYFIQELISHLVEDAAAPQF